MTIGTIDSGSPNKVKPPGGGSAAFHPRELHQKLLSLWKLSTFYRLLTEHPFRHGTPPANYSSISLTKSYLMKFAVEVGEIEKHVVEFNFNQLYGSLLIQVDDQPIHQSTRLFNEPSREIYQFVVGEHERSMVRIEKFRKQLFGHRNCVYVENRLTRVFEGL